MRVPRAYLSVLSPRAHGKTPGPDLPGPGPAEHPRAPGPPGVRAYRTPGGLGVPGAPADSYHRPDTPSAGHPHATPRPAAQTRTVWGGSQRRTPETNSADCDITATWNQNRAVSLLPGWWPPAAVSCDGAGRFRIDERRVDRQIQVPPNFSSRLELIESCDNPLARFRVRTVKHVRKD